MYLEHLFVLVVVLKAAAVLPERPNTKPGAAQRPFVPEGGPAWV